MIFHYQISTNSNNNCDQLLNEKRTHNMVLLKTERTQYYVDDQYAVNIITLFNFRNAGLSAKYLVSLAST